jgi:hypothetical protein
MLPDIGDGVCVVCWEYSGREEVTKVGWRGRTLPFVVFALARKP